MQRRAQQGERTCSSFWSRRGGVPWMPNAEEHAPRVLLDEHGAGDGCFTHGAPRGEPPCPKALSGWEKLLLGGLCAPGPKY